MRMKISDHLISVLTDILDRAQLFLRVHGKVFVAFIDICQQIHLLDGFYIVLNGPAQKAAGLIGKSFSAVV